VEALAAALQPGVDYSLLKLTPSHLEVLSKQMLPEQARDAVRALIVGGEPLSWECLEFWRKNAPRARLVNEYGPTETVVGCCAYDTTVSQEEAGAVPIGFPIAGTELYVLDAQMQLVPVGVPGELFVGGAGVARGYLNRPRATGERFLPNPFSAQLGARMYRTGDLVKRLPSGALLYLGRRDDQVKVRGYRIELREVEAVIRQHPSVAETVVAVYEGVRGQELTAYIVSAPRHDLDANQLRNFCEELLPNYSVPCHFVPVSSLPINASGKVDRSALPPPETAICLQTSELVAPRTELERRILEVVEDVLGLRPIGITANFFQLGGNSLSAIQVILRLRQLFAVEIATSLLFMRPTVETLATALAPRLRQKGCQAAFLAGTMDSPALFLLFPSCGSMLGYRELANLMGGQYSVYGIELEAKLPERNACASVHELARHCVSSILAVRSKGPYVLCGHSFGGLVAFETAQQLVAMRQEPVLIVVIDTAPPASAAVKNLPLISSPMEIEETARDIALMLQHRSAGNADMPPAADAGYLEFFWARGAWLGVTDPETIKWILVEIEAEKESARQYEPKKYQGALVVIRAADGIFSPSDLDLELGWKDVCEGAVKVLVVPGDHFSMLSSPYVKDLAIKVKDCLKSGAIVAGQERRT